MISQETRNLIITGYQDTLLRQAETFIAIGKAYLETCIPLVSAGVSQQERDELFAMMIEGYFSITICPILHLWKAPLALCS